MVGQGRPPECRRLPRCAYRVRELLLVCCALLALATVARAEEVDLQVRASWGGGAVAAWSGSISISAGSLKIENVLGLEADAAGIAVPTDEATLRIVPRTPRTYDGLDLVIRAPRDATLRLEFASATNESVPTKFEVPLEKLLGGRVVKELDATGNRIAVHRTPGDFLRFDSPRSHLIFEAGETFQATLIPHLIEGGQGTSAKCSLRLVSLPGRATVWQKEEEVALDEFGSAPGLPLEFPLPADEGVYELIAELHPKRFGAPLVRGKALAERQVQMVVLRPNRPEPTKQDWAAVAEFDPAQPKLWERMLRLPGMKAVPGLSKGPLGNEPTGTQQHLGTNWSTLKNGGWQAYPLPVSETGLPHLLEIEFPSDQGQSLAISIIEPNAAGLVAPLGVDSGIDVVATPGRTPQTLIHRLAFWPRTKSPLVLLANRGDTPAIFGKIRVQAGPSQLNSSPLATDGAAKRITAAYFDKPLFPENFSVGDALEARSGRLIDDWPVFFHGGKRLADYLHFAGHNAAVVSVLCEGSSLYPSEVLLPTPKYDMGVFSNSGHDPQRKDVLELLLQVFDRERLQFIPALSFTAPLPELEQLLATQTSLGAVGIELIGADGRRWIDANPLPRGLAPHYNLLDPRVQQAMRRVVLEVVERYSQHRSLTGIAIQLSGDGYAQLPDDACALDQVTLARFTAECGLSLPAVDPRRPTLQWDWIQREARPQWLQWRARQVTSFYRAMADDVHAIRPELQLLLCPTEPLQSRRLTTRVRPLLPPQERVADGLLQTGFDAEQLRQIPGLTLVRSRTPEPLSLAGIDPLTAELNASPWLDRVATQFTAPAALQFAEPVPLRLEAFDKVSPFGAQSTHTFLLSHLAPAGAEARKRFIHSLAAADAQTLLDGGQMLTLGQEDATRELLQVFAEIPAEAFATVPPAADDARVQPVTLRRWSSSNETWYYLLNDSPWSVIVDVDLAAASPLSMKSSGSGGRATRLLATSGTAHWKIRLQPYELSAARIAAPNVQVENWRTRVEHTVDAALREQIREIRLRANLLRSPTPLDSLANSSFEAQRMAGQSNVPAWTSATGTGVTVEVDRRAAKEGGSSLHVVSRRPTPAEAAPAVWIRSEPIPTPNTGRLAIWVWLKTSDVKRQPKLRLALEGRLDGQPYYRRANVGASEDGRPTQPLQADWSPFLFPVDDLPVQGLTDLQIGFDLMDEGELWIDQVQVFDLWFQEIERDSLLKSIALADFQVQEGKVGDSLHFVESYWPQFLRRHVSLENTRLAALPLRAAPPTSPATPAAPAESGKANGMFDGVRRWMPRMPFQK